MYLRISSESVRNKHNIEFKVTLLEAIEYKVEMTLLVEHNEKHLPNNFELIEEALVVCQLRTVCLMWTTLWQVQMTKSKNTSKSAISK